MDPLEDQRFWWSLPGICVKSGLGLVITRGITASPLRLGGLRHRQGQRIFHPSKPGRCPKGGKGGARVLWWRYWGSLGALDDAQWCLKIEDFLPKLSILVGTSYDKTQGFFFWGIFRQTHRLDGEFRPRKHEMTSFEVKLAGDLGHPKWKRSFDTFRAAPYSGGRGNQIWSRDLGGYSNLHAGRGDHRSDLGFLVLFWCLSRSSLGSLGVVGTRAPRRKGTPQDNFSFTSWNNLDQTKLVKLAAGNLSLPPHIQSPGNETLVKCIGCIPHI